MRSPGKLTLILLTFTFSASAQITSDSVSARSSPEKINPYHAIKTSIFVEKSLGDYIKSGTAVGFEVRKFTGLRHFFFATVSYGEYRGANSYRESNPTSYKLSFRSVSARLGTVISRDLYNVYLGARYIFDAKLSETFYSLSLARQLSLSGDVTPYINQVVPTAGFAFKYRVAKRFILELSYEIGFAEIFKPLEDKWMAPKTESPFLGKQQPAMWRLIGFSAHVRL